MEFAGVVMVRGSGQEIGDQVRIPVQRVTLTFAQITFSISSAKG